MFSWIVRIALETGMRLSAIDGLRLGQVDLQSGVVRLDMAKNPSPRTAPLTKAVTSAFKAAIENPLLLAETGLVFFGELGRNGMRRPYLFDKAWNDTKKAIGLVNF